MKRLLLLLCLAATATPAMAQIEMRPLPLSKGGTGQNATSVADFRDKMGLEIGVDIAAFGHNHDTAYQAKHAYLTDIAGLSPTTTGQVIKWDQTSGHWVIGTDNSSPGTLTNVTLGNLAPLFTVSKTDNSGDLSFTFNLTNAGQNAVLAGPATGGTGAPSYRALVVADIPDLTSLYATDDHNHDAAYQAKDADLTAIAGLSSADGNFIVGSASGWVVESGSTVRTSLGLGTVATLDTGTSQGNVPVLGVGGKLDDSVLPAIAISDTFVVASEAAQLALTAQVGDVAIRTDLNKTFILRVAGASTLANWSELISPTDGVTSVNGDSGPVVTLTTNEIAEGGGVLYYTEARVSANTDVAANTAARHTRGHTMASASDHTDWPTGLDVTELSYVNGVTSSIQDQLNGKSASGHDHNATYQPKDDELTDIAGLTPTVTGQIIKWNNTSGAWELGTDQGTTIPSTTNLLAGNGSGAVADSGVAASNLAKLDTANTFTAKQTFTTIKGGTGMRGIATVPLSSNNVDVTFGVTYGSNPVITLTPTSNITQSGVNYVWITNITTTGFRIQCDSNVDTTQLDFHWVAIE